MFKNIADMHFPLQKTFAKPQTIKQRNSTRPSAGLDHFDLVLVCEVKTQNRVPLLKTLLHCAASG